MKIIQEVDIKSSEKNPTNAIHIVGMTPAEFDSLRILLKTVFTYGQFSNSPNLADDLSLGHVIEQASIQGASR